MRKDMIIDEAWQAEISDNKELMAFAWAFYWTAWYDPNVHDAPHMITEIPDLVWMFLIEEELIERLEHTTHIAWDSLLEYRHHFKD